MRFLEAHAADMSFRDLACALGRSEMAVRVKAHRMLLDVRVNGRSRQRVAHNVARKMVELKISLRYFRPGREFFVRTGISQKRFWAAMRGELYLNGSELARLARELNVDMAEVGDVLQLEMEFGDER